MVYAVRKGRRQGLFTSWQEVEPLVKGFPGAEFRKFRSREEAEAWLRGQEATPQGRPTRGLVVDASCPGNPGPVEWRVYRLEDGTLLLQEGPFPGGTNNAGEFLGLVEALKWALETGYPGPVYTDSQVALAWFKRKEARAQVANPTLGARLREAEAWLQSQKSLPPVLLWEKAWGENPADYGKK